MRRLMLLAVLVAGCGGGSGRVSGPFTGATRRFYVSSLTLPSQRTDYAADLNGDGKPDNAFGLLVGVLAGQQALQEHVDEIVAAAATPMIVELTSDDPALREDATVGVRVVGGPFAPGDQSGALLHDGALRSNRVARGETVTAGLRLPLFAQADPSNVLLDDWQLDLAADGDGGFVGQLNGTLTDGSVLLDFFPAFQQLMANEPLTSFIYLFDANRDGVISGDELASSGWVKNLIASDVEVGVPANTHKDHYSLGVLLTLAPCTDDACTRPTPAPSCFDRVRNGDETDVDCGGSCGPCAGGAACARNADCVTQSCFGFRCAAPSCADGIRDGFEIDIDCGPGCGKCQNDAHCHDEGDCASGRCATPANGGPNVCAAKVQ